MRILITGADGFVGRHTLRELKQNGHEPFALVYKFSESTLPDAVDLFDIDIVDAAKINQTVDSLKPDACIHLAGIAYVPEGSSNPGHVFSVNVTGTLTLLEAFRTHSPSARMLVISTAQVYGSSPRSRPVRESDPIAPSHCYAISKVAADLMTLTYATEHRMHTMTVRPYNHIGPGQSEQFVVASFARQLKDIVDGKSDPRLAVGNLEDERDFADVRDVARAYRLLIEKGRGGEAYNIASGKPVKIRTILDMLCEIAGVTPEIEVDPARYRPTSEYPLLDIGKLEKDTGWRPEIDLKTSLQDIFAALQ